MVSVLPLSAHGLRVQRRSKRLLGPVDLRVEPGGITVVIGPNGSGKTTLLRALHGIERLDAGRVDWAEPELARARQAYVFQSPTMLRRSVLDNLRFPLDLLGRGRSTSRDLAADWAARIGLGDALNRPATRLSGGERQKLALARALIRAPEVLFLDEPCANLDGAATRAIEALLVEQRAAGLTILMATHDMGQARRLSDRGIFMLNGMVHESGAAPGIFEAPQTGELAAFLRGDIVE